MSYSYRELLKQTDDQLIEQHDAMAVNTSVGVDFFLAEMRRREQSRATMLIIRLTVANAVLAMVAVVIAVISLLVR